MEATTYKTSFRLSPAAKAALDTLAARWNLRYTQVLERVLHEACHPPATPASSQTEMAKAWNRL